MPARTRAALPWALLWVALLAPQPRACYVFHFVRSGFTANVNNLLACIALVGDGSNGTLFLNGTHFRYSCSDPDVGSWHDFFEVDQADVKALSKETPAAAVEQCEHVGVDDMGALLGRIRLPWVFALETGARMAWKPDANIRKVVQSHLDALKDLPGPTVAFHIRGGDKSMEDNRLERQTTQPIDLVSTAIRAWPDVMAHNATCILVSDDRSQMAEVEQLLKKNASCTIYRSNALAYDKGHHQRHFNYFNLESRCEQSRQVVVDLELLARADYAVASYTSGFAGLVEALRVAVYNKTRKTFVDASQDHRDAWGVVRLYLHEKRQLLLRT